MHTHTHSSYVYTQTHTYIYLGCRAVNHDFLEQYIFVYTECGQFWYIQVIKYSWKVSAELATYTDHETCGTTTEPGLRSLEAISAGVGLQRAQGSSRRVHGRAVLAERLPAARVPTCGTAQCTTPSPLEAIRVSSAVPATGWGSSRLLVVVFFALSFFSSGPKQKRPQKAAAGCEWAMQQRPNTDCVSYA